MDSQLSMTVSLGAMLLLAFPVGVAVFEVREVVEQRLFRSRVQKARTDALLAVFKDELRAEERVDEQCKNACACVDDETAVECGEGDDPPVAACLRDDSRERIAEGNYVPHRFLARRSDVERIYYQAKNTTFREPSYVVEVSRSKNATEFLQGAMMAFLLLGLAVGYRAAGEQPRTQRPAPKRTVFPVSAMLVVVGSLVLAGICFFAGEGTREEYLLHVFGYYQSLCRSDAANSVGVVPSPPGGTDFAQFCRRSTRNDPRAHADGTTGIILCRGGSRPEHDCSFRPMERVARVPLKGVSGVAAIPGEPGHLLAIQDKGPFVSKIGFDGAAQSWFVEGQFDLGIRGDFEGITFLPPGSEVAIAIEGVEADRDGGPATGQRRAYRAFAWPRWSQPRDVSVDTRDLCAYADCSDVPDNGWWEGIAGLPDGMLLLAKERDPAALVLVDGLERVYMWKGGELLSLLCDDEDGPCIGMPLCWNASDEEAALADPFGPPGRARVQISALDALSVGGKVVVAAVNRPMRTVHFMRYDDRRLYKAVTVRYRVAESDLFGEVEGVALSWQNGESDLRVLLAIDAGEVREGGWIYEVRVPLSILDEADTQQLPVSR